MRGTKGTEVFEKEVGPGAVSPRGCSTCTRECASSRFHIAVIYALYEYRLPGPFPRGNNILTDSFQNLID
jgi:hypothetical protein